MINKIEHGLLFDLERGGDYIGSSQHKDKHIFYACRECGEPTNSDGTLLSDFEIDDISWEESDDLKLTRGVCCRLNTIREREIKEDK